MNWDHEIDCIGLKCPLPVLRTRQALNAMRPGQVLRVLASDPMSRIDMPHFCAEAGHIFLTENAQLQGNWAFLIQVGQRA